MTASMNGSLDTEMLNSWRALTEDGEDDFLTEVIDIFLSTTPPLLRDLKAAAQKNEPRALQQLAHKLKGSSSNLGASQLASLCAEVESMGQSGQTTGSEESVERIEQEFWQVRDLLEKHWRVPVPPSSRASSAGTQV